MYIFIYLIRFFHIFPLLLYIVYFSGGEFYILVCSLQNIETRLWHNSRGAGHLPDLDFNLNETLAHSLYMGKNSHFRLSGSMFSGTSSVERSL